MYMSHLQTGIAPFLIRRAIERLLSLKQLPLCNLSYLLRIYWRCFINFLGCIIIDFLQCQLILLQPYKGGSSISYFITKSCHYFIFQNSQSKYFKIIRSGIPAPKLEMTYFVLYQIRLMFAMRSVAQLGSRRF